MDWSQIALLTPHWMCLAPAPWLVWAQAAADFWIGIFYMAIPLALFILVRRDRLPAPLMIAAFIAFILACGSTHLTSVVTMFFGGEAYLFHFAASVSTVIFSAAAAYALLVVVRALGLGH